MRHLILFASLAGLASCAPATQETAEAPPADPAAPAAAPASGAPGITDASTTAEVHAAFIIPGSEALFAAESTPPADDAQWTALRASAQKVIDGAELLKTGSRPQGREGWIAASDQVIAATRQTAEALAQDNADDLVFTNGDMMTGCTSCHQQFRSTVPAAPAQQ